MYQISVPACVGSVCMYQISVPACVGSVCTYQISVPACMGSVCTGRLFSVHEVVDKCAQGSHPVYTL